VNSLLRKISIGKDIVSNPTSITPYIHHPRHDIVNVISEILMKSRGKTELAKSIGD
jgi:hypothetical protein